MKERKKEKKMKQKKQKRKKKKENKKRKNEGRNMRGEKVGKKVRSFCLVNSEKYERKRNCASTSSNRFESL